MSTLAEGGLEPAPKAPASADAKLREQLLARHAASTEQQQKEIEIPGHHGLLVARYHRVPWEVSEKQSHLIRSGRPGVVLDAMLDLLIAACEEILVRREGGELIGIGAVFPELGTGPVRYTRELASAFNPDGDYTEAEARACALSMFPTEQSVAPHAAELQRWLDFSDEEDEDEDF